MSVQADNLFSLGPIVSAQTVNFPPVSSDSARRFVCKRNSLAYPGRNGFNREIRDTLLNRDKKSFIGTRTQRSCPSQINRQDLSALNLTLFGPAEEVDLKFLSYKCCFLLALASGRRRSEV
jgi:hypothetical protein